jgi:N-acetylneuraminic acid mutarotase
MAKKRNAEEAVVLQDGRVLVIGSGYNGCFQECMSENGPDQSAMHADLYTPATNTWTTTSGLNADRSNYAAVTLNDGRVLVAGGVADYPYACFSSAKLFDPATGTWTQTTGLMKWARCNPAYALLPDGKVLLAGGHDISYKPLANAEIYDPATQTWSLTGTMPVARTNGRAVALTSGKILVVGGEGSSPLKSAVLYDPASGTWSAAGTLAAQPDGALIALPDGGALVVGHAEEDNVADKWVTTAGERFDPVALTWTKVPMAKERSMPFAAGLADGRVLVAGGQVAQSFNAHGRVSTITPAAEIFDPATNKWTPTVAMPGVRQQGTAVRLQDGSVLLIGGDLGRQGEASTPGGYAVQILATAVRYVP